MRLERLVRSAIGAFAVLALVSGCGIDDTAARDLCTQYGEFQASADALRQLDPRTASADEVRAKVEDVQLQLNQVLAAADGQLNSQISTLRAAVLDLKEAAVTASDKGFATARPMLRDSLMDVEQSLAALRQAAANQCPAD